MHGGVRTIRDNSDRLPDCPIYQGHGAIGQLVRLLLLARQAGKHGGPVGYRAHARLASAGPVDGQGCRSVADVGPCGGRGRGRVVEAATIGCVGSRVWADVPAIKGFLFVGETEAVGVEIDNVRGEYRVVPVR